jgi:hypothetical protein
VSAVSDLLTLNPLDARSAGQEHWAVPDRADTSSGGDETLTIAAHGHRLSAGALAVALGYATLRYNVFKGVPWADWPSYTVNKALAVAALLLVVAAVLRIGRVGTLLAWAGVLALAHSLLSFALFDPAYFPRLFDGAKLTALAGIAMTLGVVAMAGMELGARRAGAWGPALRHKALAWLGFAAGVHAALPALSTWVEPAGWPGGLPPLTLISFAAGVIGLATLLPRRRAQTSEQ